MIKFAGNNELPRRGAAGYKQYIIYLSQEKEGNARPPLRNELSLQKAAGYQVGSCYSPMKLISSEFEFIPRCEQRGIRT